MPRNILFTAMIADGLDKSRFALENCCLNVIVVDKKPVESGGGFIFVCQPTSFLSFYDLVVKGESNDWKKRKTKQSTLFKFQSIYQENTNWKYYCTWSSASHAKVYPFAGRRKYLLFSATLRPWVLFRPRESNPWPPTLQSSTLPTELILPWIRNYLCPRMLGVSLQMCQFKHSRYWQALYLFWLFY